MCSHMHARSLIACIAVAHADVHTDADVAVLITAPVLIVISTAHAPALLHFSLPPLFNHPYHYHTIISQRQKGEFYE